MLYSLALVSSPCVLCTQGTRTAEILRGADESGTAVGEQERQLRALFNHVRSLQHTIDLTHDTVDVKVLEKVTENEEMLQEVNELRKYVRYFIHFRQPISFVFSSFIHSP